MPVLLILAELFRFLPTLVLAYPVLQIIVLIGGFNLGWVSAGDRDSRGQFFDGLASINFNPSLSYLDV